MVRGEGSSRPRLILIGEALGEEEAAQGRPFVGSSGILLMSLLANIGLRREDCYLDNVVPIRPPNNKLERLPELGMHWQDFIPSLHERLSKIDCPVIIALGGTACYALTGKGVIDKQGEVQGVSKHRGSVYLFQDRLVIPTFHPRFIIENWKMRGVVVEDLKKGLRIIKEGYHAPRFNTIIKPNLSEIEEFCRLLRETDRISMDIEVVGSGQIACIGLGGEGDSLSGRASLCIPFKFGYHNYWNDLEEWHIWELLRDLFQGDQLKIGQNLNYDFTKLLPFIGEPAPPWFDCMIAYHLLEPELPHTLAFMTSLYTWPPVNYYKDDPKDEELSWKYATSSEQLWEYNGKDVEVPLELEPKLTADLKEIGMLSRFHGYDMAKMRVMWRVQQRGMLIDEEKRTELLITQLAKLEGDKTELARIVGYELNPMSSKQMIQFLKDRGIPVPLHRKTHKPTTNEESLNKLIARYPRPEFQLALDIRDSVKDIGTYLAGMNKETGEYSKVKTDEDGRARGRYNTCGTGTGRSSSKKTYDDTGFDMQNIPEVLREMFIAPEGKMFITFDLWQAEAYVVAILANCQPFLEKLQKGEKLHRLVASWLFGITEEQVDNNNRPGGQYYTGKRTLHGYNYGLGWNTLSTILKVPAAVAKVYIKKLDLFAPEIEMWHREIQDELQRTKVLITPLGRRRVFRERWGEDMFRKAYAHIPQSTVAEYNHQAIIKMEYWLPEGAEIVQEGFDAFTVECLETQPEEVKGLAEKAFDKKITWKGVEFKIPVEEAGRGKRWKK